ncbi:hypothetical protein KKD87_01895, partial [bacterium]|nr:hypothetical protein [bacterium]
IISEMADKKANIIYGQAIDESLHDEMHITIIATGFGEVKEKEKPSSKTTINLEDYRYEKPGIRIKKDNLRREILIGPEKFLSKDSREIEEIPAVFRKIAD